MNAIRYAMTMLLLGTSSALGGGGETSAREVDVADEQTSPDFQRHVVPLLGRLGCNAAKCHGSFQGQGGFRLSLFGFDFRSDHAALHDNATSESGSRIQIEEPEQSLILLKATGTLDHEGGDLIEPDSWEYQLLVNWIRAGAAGADSAKLPEGDSSTVDRELKAKHEYFRTQVRPLLNDHCSECHGYGQAKGGLSLANRDSMLKGGKSGAAVVPGHSDRSLLMRAVRYGDEDLQMPPSGELSADEISILETWIDGGAVWPKAIGPRVGETNQKLVRLEVEPAELTFKGNEHDRPLQVTAIWESGLREDVTRLSRFQTNDDTVATVDRDGIVASIGPGDSHVIVFYDNGVAAVPVLRRFNTEGFEEPFVADESSHPIDVRVNAKLAKVGLLASERCTDEEFLRRVSIDMTGTLPTPDEIQEFLVDSGADKRARKIDELLERSTYAAWWANKLCDFTGCNPVSISSLLEVAREEGYVKASEWYDWTYDRVEENAPYDELVAGIMLADLRGDDGMPHFWQRSSLKESKDTAMSVAHAFLGIQLQCAECHKHPFDQWTQADFVDFTKFFDSVTTSKVRSEADQPQRVQLLRSRHVDLQSGDDPRLAVMQWMRASETPWMARAFVNRVWASYFHVGIVDPPDQFTPANPPSNPELLDWLTTEFIRHDYDMKWLHRTITTSDAYQRSWKPNSTNREDRRNFSRAIPRRIPAEVVYDAMKQATVSERDQAEVRTNLRRRASGHLSMRMAGTHAMKVFGKPDRSVNCDCERVNEPTLLQAIFLQNDPLVRMRIADSGWLYDLQDAQEAGETLDPSKLVQQVWLRTVARYPSEAEQERALRHFEDVAQPTEAVADLLWAMMNTKEFLLNH